MKLISNLIIFSLSVMLGNIGSELLLSWSNQCLIGAYQNEGCKESRLDCLTQSIKYEKGISLIDCIKARPFYQKTSPFNP